MRDPHIADGSTVMKCLLQLIFCTSSPSKGCFWEHVIRFKDSVHQHLRRHRSYQHWLLEQSKCTATCPRRHVQCLRSRKWEFIWISQCCIPEPLKFSNTDFLVQTRSREHCGDQESSSSRSMLSSQCIWQCFKCWLHYCPLNITDLYWSEDNAPKFGSEREHFCCLQLDCMYGFPKLFPCSCFNGQFPEEQVSNAWKEELLVVICIFLHFIFIVLPWVMREKFPIMHLASDLCKHWAP